MGVVRYLAHGIEVDHGVGEPRRCNRRRRGADTAPTFQRATPTLDPHPEEGVRPSFRGRGGRVSAWPQAIRRVSHDCLVRVGRCCVGVELRAMRAPIFAGELPQKWADEYKVGNPPNDVGCIAVVIYEYPTIGDFLSTGVAAVILIAIVVIPFRIFLRWRDAGGFRERRDKRRAFWIAAAFIPWAWGLCIHWLAVEAVIMAGKFQGRGAVVEGVVGQYSCGGRSATKLRFAGDAEDYVVRSCPGHDAIRVGEAVRLLSVIGVYGDREVIRLENLSRGQPE